MASEPKRPKIQNHYYQPNWEEEFFIVPLNDTCACLVCGNVFGTNRKSNVHRHFLTQHGDMDVDFPKNSEARTLKIEALKVNLLSNFEKKPIDPGNLVTNDAMSTTRLSFRIAFILARAMKPFEDGLIIKEGMIEMAKELLQESEVKNRLLAKVNRTPLSGHTIKRRVDAISEDIHDQLIADLQKCVWFSIQLSEGTEVSDTTQLSVHIRMVFDDCSTTEELLSVITLKGRPTEEEIISALKDDLIKNNVPLKKLVSMTSAMAGRQAGLLALCREDPMFRPALLNCHCIIKQQALCVKSIDMSHVMQPVVKAVNLIRGKPLQHRLFQSLLKEVEGSTVDILSHSGVRWSSRGKVLNEFYNALPTIREFLESSNEDVEVLSDQSWLTDLAFFADLMKLVNELNLQLKGTNIPIWTSVDKVTSFRGNLRLWKTFLREGSISPAFEILTKMQQESDVTNDCKERFIVYLEKLANEYKKQFEDFEAIRKVREYFCAPMTEEQDDRTIAASITNLFPSLNRLTIREEMASLRNSEIDRFRFNKIAADPDDMWKQVDGSQFSSLTGLYKRLLSCFGSSYSSESMFPSTKNVRSRLRSRLNDDHLESLMRISTSSYEPDFDKLAKNTGIRRQSEAS